MPTIGPDTIDGLIAAGIGGLCVNAGGVLVLEQDVTVNKATVGGLSFWAEEGPL